MVNTDNEEMKKRLTEAKKTFIRFSDTFLKKTDEGGFFSILFAPKQRKQVVFFFENSKSLPYTVFLLKH